MKTILNVSRLHQQELLHVLKMIPDDEPYVITGYKIINPDDPPVGDPPDMIAPRDVTVEQYESEVAAYASRHAADPEAPGIRILETYTKENVLAPDIIDNIKVVDVSTVPPDVVSGGYDLIVVGISDTGVNIFKKCGGEIGPDEEVTPEYSQFQALSDARDAGIPIMFTHDCLEVNSFAEPFPDDYDALIGNFGVLSYNSNVRGDIVEDITCTDLEHPIMSSYFELPETLDVQTTHHGGLVLKEDADIIYINTGKTPGDENYYLATYEETGKGKVAIILMGHCFGNHNQFFRPSIDECKILVNTFVWLLV